MSPPRPLRGLLLACALLATPPASPAFAGSDLFEPTLTALARSGDPKPIPLIGNFTTFFCNTTPFQCPVIDRLGDVYFGTTDGMLVAVPGLTASFWLDGETGTLGGAGTGAVFCWGLDADGQASPPDAVDGSTGTASRIVANGDHTCAIQSGSSEVFCWGAQDFGETFPPPGLTAEALSAGPYHTLAIVPEPDPWLAGLAALSVVLRLRRRRRRPESGSSGFAAE